MEYAISIGVVAAFALAYILLRQPLKPRYPAALDEESFLREARALIRGMPLPEKKAEISPARYVSTIKRDIFLLKRKRYGGQFDAMLIGKDKLKELSSLPMLSDLPSVNGEPRAVLLARFVIERGARDNFYSHVRAVLEEQNAWRTLTFAEIEGMKQAFSFVLLEQLASAYQKLYTVAKCGDIAQRYVSMPLSVPKKYKNFANSRLFLSLCARCAGYRAQYYSDIYDGCISAIRDEIERACALYEEVKRLDFSPFYSPLEIYDKYSVFSEAEQSTKRNFLRLAGEISDAQNIDEFLLAVRIDKYMRTASCGHFSLKCFRLFGKTGCLISERRDISMLATALSSHYFMDIYFRQTSNRFSRKSITKILEFENTFEPIYKFRTINFGISAKDGILSVHPRLPSEVTEADVKFAYGGATHSLHIRRGDEGALFMGDTRINGVSGISIGARPLDVTVIVPPDKPPV